MARYCQKCWKKLPWFSFRTICKECEETEKAEKIRSLKEYVNKKPKIIEAITTQKEIPSESIELLQKQPKKILLDLYSEIYAIFTNDNELDEKEIQTLRKLQETFNLTNDEVKYEERVQPYIYVFWIRNKGILPTIELSTGSLNIVLKKDERVHFYDFCILKEWKTVTLGYAGRSQGVSFRIAKGVTYRVGTHRGNLVREQFYVESSRGWLILTNQRLLLVPTKGSKQLNVPLKKIVSYQCYENGIELFVERREKGYLLTLTNSGAIEIFGLCLNFLLEYSE